MLDFGMNGLPRVNSDRHLISYGRVTLGSSRPLGEEPTPLKSLARSTSMLLDTESLSPVFFEALFIGGGASSGGGCIKASIFVGISKFPLEGSCSAELKVAIMRRMSGSQLGGAITRPLAVFSLY